MAKAEALRVQEVRDAYRLIGDCRDLGSDPALWQPRMFEGLAQLFGGTATTGGEGRVIGTDGAVVPLTYFDFGFDPRDRRTYLTYMRSGGPIVDPFILAFRRASGANVALRLSETVDERAYQRSELFERYFGPGNVRYRLASMFPTAGHGAISLLHLHRGPRDRDFSARERALLGFFHREIGPLVGRALVSAAEPTPDRLSPRLRQTLACLVEGDSEKQVAARLGVSHSTAHQYVTELYRRFGVGSRGQLLAHVVKRIARREWRDALPHS